MSRSIILITAFIALVVGACSNDVADTADAVDATSTEDSGAGDSNLDLGQAALIEPEGASVPPSEQVYEADELDENCDGDAPPAPAELVWKLDQVKQFEFIWEAVSGADYYQLFEKANLSANFVQVGADIVATKVALTVPLYARANASYFLRACNPWGCTDSNVVDVVGTLVNAIGYFKASNTAPMAHFGGSVALSGDGRTLAVGAPGDNSSATGINGDQTDSSAEGSGAVYLFVRDESGHWSQQAYVKASNTDEHDKFGSSVALSKDGSTLAVGATWEDSGATGTDGDQTDNSTHQAGAVYLFVRDAWGQWSQQAYVKASNTDVYDRFGWSLALSADGETLAVGTPWEDSGATGIGGDQADNSVLQAGAVYLFVRDGQGQWSQQAYVKGSNTEGFDHFGISLALSGDGKGLAVGAHQESSNAAGIDGDQANNDLSAAGAAYVFMRDGQGQWSQQAYIKASNPDPSDYFGSSVALSAEGHTLAVGAPGESSGATRINGDQTDNSAADAGAVYAFVRDGQGQWSQQAYIKASHSCANNEFWWNTPDRFSNVALSADGHRLAVGAHGECSDSNGINGDPLSLYEPRSGAVYMFERNGLGQWLERAYIKASDPNQNDRFGRRVALAGDGDTLAAGSWGESSKATGIGGSHLDNSCLGAGAVHVY